MNIYTETNIEKMSFADLKAAYDFCVNPTGDGIFYIEYSRIGALFLNEMQYRMHLFFKNDEYFTVNQ